VLAMIEGDRALVVDASKVSDLPDFAVAAFATQQDVRKGPLHMRRLAREAGADCVVILTANWERQSQKPLFLSSLALAGVRCFAHDLSRDDRFVEVSRTETLGALIMLPLTVAAALALAWFHARRVLRDSKVRVQPSSQPPGNQPAVIVIWLIREGFEVGGGISHIAGIMEGFRECGYRVGLVSRGAPPRQLEGLFDEHEPAALPSGPMRLLPYTEWIGLNSTVIKAAERLALRLPPTVIYERLEAYSAPGAALAGRMGVPVVLEVNGPELWVRSNWASSAPGEKFFLTLGERIEAHALRSASVVAAVSANALNATIEECGAEPIKALISPNAVSVSKVISETVGLSPSPIPPVRLGWIGTFGPWHGAPMMVRALAEMPESVTGLLIGDGAERDECRELAESLGVSARLDMPGRMARSDALRELAKCHILVSPHVPTGDQPFFGSPTKLFDFMALGRPIVASRLEQIGEIIDDGKTGILVEPGDLGSLVAGVKRVIDSPDMGVEMGNAAQSEALQLHTWDKRIRDILASLDPAMSVSQF